MPPPENLWIDSTATMAEEPFSRVIGSILGGGTYSPPDFLLPPLTYNCNDFRIVRSFVIPHNASTWNTFRYRISPSCGAEGNVLDLWAAVHKLPLREAALDLIETFVLDVPAAEKRQPVVPLSQSDRAVATNVVTCDRADRALQPETTQSLPQRC